YPVPSHLKNAVYEGEMVEGKGQGYKYAHSYPNGYVQQEYLPEPKKYYEPTERGYEKKIKDWLGFLKRK
ncbi:MAG: replication-associated recombination protein A, partial [Patescibacteria group bacterium]